MSKRSPEERIDANGVLLNMQSFGDASQPSVILIMGLGMQMIAWPEPFCKRIANRGFRVIRFDNRDCGLSQTFDGQRASFNAGEQSTPPYTLQDMAGDVVNLMDAINLESAHIVGASMGGMIAQWLAADFPGKVKTLTSIMSSSGNPELPQPRDEVLQTLMTPAAKSEEEYLATAMHTWRLIGSPGYPVDGEELRKRLQYTYQRNYNPAGTARHLAAVLADGSRQETLARINVPSLVIHGSDDPLIPVEGGIDTARHIPGATLEIIEGMGHDLPQPLWPRLTDLIVDHIGG